MLMRKLFIICIFLLLIASPVYAHDAELHVSDVEKLVAGIGALILALSLLSLLFKKEPDEPLE
jgi:hypothetical protein